MQLLEEGQDEHRGYALSRPSERGVAQSGSALRFSRKGRWFKSSHPDDESQFVILNTEKEVVLMASEREYLEIANKRPSQRSAQEQAMVDKGSNIQSVRNADFYAREAEKYGRK